MTASAATHARLLALYLFGWMLIIIGAGSLIAGLWWRYPQGQSVMLSLVALVIGLIAVNLKDLFYLSLTAAALEMKARDQKAEAK